MADFRRIIVGLVALFLFAGLASAQIVISGNSTGALQCNASVAVPPQMRAEGLTEMVGDIVLTCTGGGQTLPGGLIPQANFVVYLNTAVTSRLLPNANNTGGTANVGEPILMIDEPGASYAPAAAQTPCLTPLSGCQEFASQTVYQSPVLHNASGADVTPAPNMFQGIVSGNSVTFLGVPVLAPVSTGFARVFRITNIRANANQLGGGAAASAVQVVASIAISGSTSVPINNPTQIVGYVAKGLTTAIRDAINGGNQSAPYNYAQCQSANYGFVTGTVATFNGSSTYGPARRLRFTENFATAFKTRTFASTSVVAQNIPGTIYNSESGFIYSSFSNYTGSQSGLADYGTRLKAVFNNVPAGVRVFVGVSQASSGTAGASAQLTVSETGAYSPVIGAIGPSGSYVPSGVMIAELPVVSGSASAVWEVTSGAASNASTVESLDFDVYLVYTANPGSNSPAPGTITVNQSFAPVPPAFTASAGAAASASLPIPRFADTSTANGIFAITICRTILLFPYVTNAASFDTGIAVANTSTDPFGTTPQSGNCTWYVYGTNAPSTPPAALSVPSGTVNALLASSALPANFTGYIIAICNFQYGHGFAFVSDFGAQKLAMGYLALVIADPGTASRVANPFGGSIVSLGEQAGH